MGNTDDNNGRSTYHGTCVSLHVFVATALLCKKHHRKADDLFEKADMAKVAEVAKEQLDCSN